jgi:hypothetical protein
MSTDQEPIDDKPFMVTFFPTQQALSKTERKVTVEELAELIRRTHAVPLRPGPAAGPAQPAPCAAQWPIRWGVLR